MRTTRFPDYIVSQQIHIASVLYDFATDGGVGEATIHLPGLMPAGALVMGGYIHVEIPLADDGGETPGSVQVSLEDSGDIIATTATDDALWSAAGRKDIVPIGTDQDTWVLTTEERNIKVLIENADLTAGRFWVHMFYHVPLTSAEALA